VLIDTSRPPFAGLYCALRWRDLLRSLCDRALRGCAVGAHSLLRDALQLEFRFSINRSKRGKAVANAEEISHDEDAEHQDDTDRITFDKGRSHDSSFDGSDETAMPLS